MINSHISKQTSYQVNGADSVGIRKRKYPGGKGCCMRKLVPAYLISFCTDLHSLSDESVTSYFHTTCDTRGEDSSEPSSKRLRTEWYFLGHHTTVECLQSLLGMSTRAFYKKCHGTVDTRKFPSPIGHWDALRWQLVARRTNLGSSLVPVGPPSGVGHDSHHIPAFLVQGVL